MSSLPWDDDDVLLRLFPLNEPARKCCKRHNIERYLPSPSQKDVSSQENTPAPSSLSTFDGDFLELRFSDAFSGKWSIGRLESCYVVLQGPGVSSKHCDIIATEYGFYVVDQSTFGTAVAFDCNELTFQRHGSWKIANRKGTKEWFTLAVRIGENVFSVQLRDSGFEGQNLSNNVKEFVKHAKSGLPDLPGFDLGSASTTLQPPTPYEAIDMLGAGYPTLFTSTEASMPEPIDLCEDNTRVNSRNDTNKEHDGSCYQSSRSGRYRHSSIAERHGYNIPSGPLQKKTCVSTQAKGPETRAPQRRICGVDGCGKSYTDRGSMCRHRKVHNSQAAETACKVPNCNFKTKRADTLRTHYLRHVNAPDQTCNKRHVARVSAEELKTLLGPEDTELFQSVMDKYGSSRSEKPGTVSVGSDVDHNHMPGVKNPLSCTLDEALTFGLSDAREAFTQELAEVAQHSPATESNMEADLDHEANMEYSIFDYRSSGPCPQMTSVSIAEGHQHDIRSQSHLASGSKGVARKTTSQDYQCESTGCKRTFTDRSAYNRHLRVDHDPNRAYISCRVPNCAFKTKRIDTIPDHYFTHVILSDEIPYQARNAKLKMEELETLLGSKHERLLGRLRLMKGKFEPRKD